MGYGSNRGKDRGRRTGGREGGRRERGFGGSTRRFTGGYGRTGGGGGGGYGARPQQPVGNAPVEAGKEYEVEITEISRRGDGIAKVQGFIIFVPGAQPSTQKVKIKIERVSARFASASLVGGASEGESSSSEEGGDESSAENEDSASASSESDSEFESDDQSSHGGSSDLVESV